MVLNKSFWNGKNVLVTGHTGFKGSWLCLMLRELGAEVFGYSLDIPSNPSMFELVGIENEIHHHQGDINSIDHLNEVLHEIQPEVVFHLAAESIVSTGYNDPVKTYLTNVMGTVNILQVCRNIDSLRAIVNVTSDKCYKNKTWDWPYRENDELGGKDPYSNSKSCAELVTSCFYETYFETQREIGVATARAGNVIGGGDFSANRIVPDLVRSMEREQTLILRNPQATRPWQHVLEPLFGYLILAERLYQDPKEFSGAWNFGPGSEDNLSVEQLLSLFDRHWKKLDIKTEPKNNNIKEAQKLNLDSSKSRSNLNWIPKWSIDMCVRQTSIWYKSYFQKEDILMLTKSQILQYLTE